MKARPILFSGAMVQALLAGRKTQTRRVVKQDWHACLTGDCVHQQQALCDADLLALCPYGKPGDLLWVRESITTRDKAEDGLRFDEPQYRADFTDPYGLCFTTEDGPRYVEQLRWTPSIHMPRAASRLTLRITDVRVERLQEISPADAKAEGDHERSGMPEYYERGAMCHVDWYRHLWEQINGPDSWAANPWVWVISFEVISANVDQVTGGRAA